MSAEVVYKKNKVTWKNGLEPQANSLGIHPSRRSLGKHRLHGNDNASLAIPHYLKNTESSRRRSYICKDEVNPKKLETPLSRELSCKTAYPGSQSNTLINNDDLPLVEVEHLFQRSGASKYELKFPLIFYSSNYSNIEEYPCELYNCNTGKKTGPAHLKAKIAQKQTLLQLNERVQRWRKRDQLKRHGSSLTRISLKNRFLYEYISDEPILVSRLTFPPPPLQLNYQSLNCIPTFSDTHKEKTKDRTRAVEIENEADTSDETSSFPLPHTLKKTCKHFHETLKSAAYSAGYSEPMESPPSMLLPYGKGKLCRSKGQKPQRCSDKPLIYEYMTANGDEKYRDTSPVTPKFSRSRNRFFGLETKGNVIKFKEDKVTDAEKIFRPKSPVKWVEADLAKLPSELLIVEDTGKVACNTNERKNKCNQLLSNSNESVNINKNIFKSPEEEQKISQITGESKTNEEAINGQVIFISRAHGTKSRRPTLKRGKVSSRGLQGSKLTSIIEHPCKPMKSLIKNGSPNSGDRAFVIDTQYEPIERYRSRSWEFLNQKTKSLERSLSWSYFPKLDSGMDVGSFILGQKCNKTAELNKWLQDVTAFNCAIDNCCRCSCPPCPCSPCSCSCSPSDSCSCDNPWQTFSFNCTPSNHLTGCACRGRVLLQPDYGNLSVCPCGPVQKASFAECGEISCVQPRCEPIVPVIPVLPCPPRPPPVPPPPVPEKRPPPRPPKKRQPPPPTPGKPPRSPYSPPGKPNQPGRPPSGQPPPFGTPPPPGMHYPPGYNPPGYPPGMYGGCPPPCCIPCCISCCRSGRAFRDNLKMLRSRGNVQQTFGNRQMLVCCAPWGCCPPGGPGIQPMSRRRRKVRTK